MTLTTNEILLETLKSQGLEEAIHTLAKITDEDDLQRLLVAEYNSSRDIRIVINLLKNKNLKFDILESILSNPKNTDYVGTFCSYILANSKDQYSADEKPEIMELILSKVADRSGYEYPNFVYEFIAHPSTTGDQLDKLFAEHRRGDNYLVGRTILSNVKFSLENNSGIIDWTNLNHLAGIAARPDLTVDVAAKVLAATAEVTHGSVERFWSHPVSQMLTYGAKDAVFHSTETTEREGIIALLVQEPYVWENAFTDLTESGNTELSKKNKNLLNKSIALSKSVK